MLRAFAYGELTNQRPILEDSVVIDRNRNDEQLAVVCRIAADAEDVVEQTDFGRFELAVSRQPALEKDPLRHAHARDLLDVTFEHHVVERLAILAPYEIRAEGLEHVLEWKGARP